MKSTRKIYLPVILAFLLHSCSTVPFTGRKQLTAIPSEQMVALGVESYDQALEEQKLSDNQQYINMVTSVGREITAAVETYLNENDLGHRIENYNWEFSVIESDALNAWCLPGGKIAFYEGIIPVCEDKNGIAVVMSHEIAHAVADHGNERMSQQLGVQLGGMALSKALEQEKETTQQIAFLAFGVGSQLGVILPYSRTHEKEADEMGLYFMAMAGYDPAGSVEFWQRMSAQQEGRVPEFLSTHPNPESRIRRLKKLIPDAMEYYKP